MTKSPYARRAWVEISVSSSSLSKISCRPTHVGRGLKSVPRKMGYESVNVALRT